MLRCKVRVAEVLQSKNAEGGTESEHVKLVAVSGKEGTENAEWSKYTPQAAFSLQISNPAAFGKLSKGHEFYVDFTPCEPAPEPSPEPVAEPT